MTESQEENFGRRRRKRRLVILVTVVVLFAPVCTLRSSESCMCVICGARSFEDRVTVYLVPVWSERTPDHSCVRGEHRWGLTSMQSHGLIPVPWAYHASGRLYESVRELPWGEWLDDDPDGPEQARVLAAIRRGTWEEVDELIGCFTPARDEETGLYLWSEEQVVEWADRVLARVGE